MPNLLHISLPGRKSLAPWAMQAARVTKRQERKCLKFAELLVFSEKSLQASKENGFQGLFSVRWRAWAGEGVGLFHESRQTI